MTRCRMSALKARRPLILLSRKREPYEHILCRIWSLQTGRTIERLGAFSYKL